MILNKPQPVRTSRNEPEQSATSTKATQKNSKQMEAEGSISACGWPTS